MVSLPIRTIDNFTPGGKDDIKRRVVTNVVGVASRNTSVTSMLLKCSIFNEAAFEGFLLIFCISLTASRLIKDVKK
mgnify:CR=1 FL=1